VGRCRGRGLVVRRWRVVRRRRVGRAGRWLGRSWCVAGVARRGVAWPRRPVVVERRRAGRVRCGPVPGRSPPPARACEARNAADFVVSPAWFSWSTNKQMIMLLVMKEITSTSMSQSGACSWMLTPGEKQPIHANSKDMTTVTAMIGRKRLRVCGMARSRAAPSSATAEQEEPAPSPSR